MQRKEFTAWEVLGKCGFDRVLRNFKIFKASTE